MGKKLNPSLDITQLIQEAKNFCQTESMVRSKSLFGVTDGKAVGTFIEQKFKKYLLDRYVVQIGNSASGIDLPSEDIQTDIKASCIHTQTN